MNQAQYTNHTGKVTGISEDSIEISSRTFRKTTPEAKKRVARADVSIGSEVEFNYNTATNEIIFIRDITPYTPQPWFVPLKRKHSSRGYSEDPRDPDEVHDMEAVYGHDFEGM